MNLTGSTVAVTGATGMVGSYLVRTLVERGARVIAAVRSPAKMSAAVGKVATSDQVEVRRADLTDREALTRAFDGCDAVFSNAAVVSIGQHSREHLMQTNVQGTANVFEAMRRCGVQRAVMTSSTSVYARKRGTYREGDPLWERDAWVPRPLYYGITKAQAEREAWRLAGEYDIDLSVARPSGIYGANDNTGFTAWIRRLTRIPLVTVFPTHCYVPAVYAGDLAEAMVRMLERPSVSGQAYNVCGDPDISFWSLLRAYRAAGGDVPPVVLPFPFPLRFTYAIERAKRDLDFENRPLVDGFTHLRSLR